MINERLYVDDLGQTRTQHINSSGVLTDLVMIFNRMSGEWCGLWCQYWMGLEIFPMFQQYLLCTCMQVQKCVQYWGYRDELDNMTLWIWKVRKSWCGEQVILKFSANHHGGYRMPRERRRGSLRRDRGWGSSDRWLLAGQMQDRRQAVSVGGSDKSKGIAEPWQVRTGRKDAGGGWAGAGHGRPQMPAGWGA